MNKINEGTTISNGKGERLEETLREYFRRIGYFSARGLPFVFDGDDVTDLDIFLYERPGAAGRRRTIVDVKNKARPKAVERIVWTAGLCAGLGLEAAIVATTDSRNSVRSLARSLGLNLFDGEMLKRIQGIQQLANSERVSKEEFDRIISQIDSHQGEKTWTRHLKSTQSLLVSDLGIRSANACLDVLQPAIELLLVSQNQHQILRLIYLLTSYAALSFDFATRDMTFASSEEIKRFLDAAIRFGETGDGKNLERIRFGFGLARQFADNGPAVAKQIEDNFSRATNQLRSDTLSEPLSKIVGKDTLFQVAVSLEHISHLKTQPAFDQLPTPDKSMLASILDFHKFDRERFAAASTAATQSINKLSS